MPDSGDIYSELSELSDDELFAYDSINPADTAYDSIDPADTKGDAYRERIETDQRALEYARELIDAVVYPENKKMVRYAASDAAILACILRASGWYVDLNTGLPAWGGGLDWALQACVVRPWADEQPPEDDSAFDLAEPSWLNSFSRLNSVDSSLAAAMILALSLNTESHDRNTVRLAQALTKEACA